MAAVLRKARFWEQYAGTSFNDRQRKIINQLLNGFEGKLTSSKWAKLAKCSQDTALRDIEDLVRKGVLVKDAAGGRSTSYSLAEIARPVRAIERAHCRERMSSGQLGAQRDEVLFHIALE